MVMAPAAPCPPSRTSTVWLFGGCRVSAVTRRVPSGDWLASRFIHFVATCWRTFGTLQFSAMANGATCALGPGSAWGPALVSLRPAVRLRLVREEPPRATLAVAVPVQVPGRRSETRPLHTLAGPAASTGVAPRCPQWLEGWPVFPVLGRHLSVSPRRWIRRVPVFWLDCLLFCC